MKVRTLIVDDEPIARAGLRDLVSGIEWIEVCGEAASGPAAVEAIDTQHPELVFLDIQMPGMSGTEVLRQVKHQPHVVFTTAYAQHAAAAFELGALDYVLKPFGRERLTTTLARVRAALGEPMAQPTADRLAEALAKGPMTRLFVRSGTAIVPVSVDSISRFEADGDYVVASVSGGRTRHVLHLALSRLEARLDPARFVRIHRTCIVNLDRVTVFKRRGKGRLVAVLDDGSEHAVSRARSRTIRDAGA